ncbi:MAG: hypothetical protein IJV91_03200 [Kiritimatiellae bacterium]|nr:hypothetical protein [Kiritimatiellia bacterium]
MSRVTINVDLDTNEVFSAEMQKAIESEVRKITREQVSAVLEDEIKRLIRARLNEYEKASQWSQVQQKFNAAVDAQVQLQLKETKLTRPEIEAMVEKHLRHIDVVAQKKLDGIDATISRVIDRTVKSLFSDKISSAFAKAIMDNAFGGEET